MSYNKFCPKCGNSDITWCPEHRIKIRGGYSEHLLEEACLLCGYISKPYPKELKVSRPIIIMDTANRPQKYRQKEATIDEKITFTAKKGDMEINIKVGKDGLNKLMSIFMEG
jgi:hypothetical protein